MAPLTRTQTNGWRTQIAEEVAEHCNALQMTADQIDIARQVAMQSTRLLLETLAIQGVLSVDHAK